jgi:superfamily II DNA/RNA helicase
MATLNQIFLVAIINLLIWKSISSSLLKNTKLIQQSVNFAGVQFHPPLSSAIQSLGIESTPSPIQTAALPPLCMGLSCVLHAPTGTGKTFAYLLPILRSILEDEQEFKEKKPFQALIIAPTRELSTQVRDIFEFYLFFLIVFF